MAPLKEKYKVKKESRRKALLLLIIILLLPNSVCPFPMAPNALLSACRLTISGFASSTQQLMKRKIEETKSKSAMAYAPKRSVMQKKKPSASGKLDICVMEGGAFQLTSDMLP
mmetsp:Transcript_21294/g.70600  ORF Transcript_21294/g.70600 Transcript_21294/m.70600 type:complete len:113 (+) Transcript_21294:467-805(+)